MNQKQLEIFKTLAETLNFTRTAEQLYLSQTTVTLQIHNLEEELHVKLFERTSRSVRLSPAGMTFYEGVVKILDLIRQTVDNTVISAQGYTGILEIGFANESNATGISGLIREYMKMHPATRLQVHGGYPGELLNMLMAEHCDVIFTPAFDRLSSGTLESHPIGSYKLIAAFNKEHHFSKKKKLHYSDFAGEKFIYVSNAAAELDFTYQFVKQLEEVGIHADTFARTDNIDSVFLMLDANLAVTVLPEYFVDRFYGCSNIRVCQIDEKISETNFLATWKTGRNTAELESFIRFMKKYFHEDINGGDGNGI